MPRQQFDVARMQGGIMGKQWVIILLMPLILPLNRAGAQDILQGNVLKAEELDRLKKDSYLAETIIENELLKMELKKVSDDIAKLNALKDRLARLEGEKILAEKNLTKEKAGNVELAQAIVEARKKQYILKKAQETIQKEKDIVQDKLIEATKERGLQGEKLHQCQKLLALSQDKLKSHLEQKSQKNEKLIKQMNTFKNNIFSLKEEKEAIQLKLKEKERTVDRLSSLVSEKEKALQELESLCQLLEKEKREKESINQ